MDSIALCNYKAGLKFILIFKNYLTTSINHGILFNIRAATKERRQSKPVRYIFISYFCALINKIKEKRKWKNLLQEA